MTESKTAEASSSEVEEEMKAEAESEATEASEESVAEELLSAAEALEEAEASVKEEPADQELLEFKERHLRLAAEYDNFRKRTAREKQDLAKYAKSDVLEKLLPVLDTVERGVQLNAQAGSIDTVREGLVKVHKQMMEILGREGLSAIEEEGVPFEPAIHMAVMQDVSEEHEPDMVIQVFEKGWKLEDKVLRPAKVKVSAS